MIETLLSFAAIGLVVIGLFLAFRVPYLRSITKQTFLIIWRKKYLWFIGFFAGLLFGRGEPDYLFQNLNSQVYSIAKLQQWLVGLRDAIQGGDATGWWNYVHRLFVQAPGLMTAYLLLPIALAIVLIWLISVSQGTIIRIVSRMSEKKNASLFDGIAAGTSAFWRVLSINLMSVLVLAVLTILLVGVPAAAFFISGNGQWAAITSVMLFIVTVPVSMLMSFLVKFSVASTVVDGIPPMVAFRKTWGMVQRNLMAVLEMSFVIYAVTLVIYSIVLSMVSFYVQPTSFVNLGVVLATIALVFAFNTTFSYTAWTLIFMQLRQGDANSAFGRWTSRLVNFSKAKPSVS